MCGCDIIKGLSLSKMNGFQYMSSFMDEWPVSYSGIVMGV
jgi:hypothetical protein